MNSKYICLRRGKWIFREKQPFISSISWARPFCSTFSGIFFSAVKGCFQFFHSRHMYFSQEEKLNLKSSLVPKKKFLTFLYCSEAVRSRSCAAANCNEVCCSLSLRLCSTCGTIYLFMATVPKSQTILKNAKNCFQL